VRFLVDASLSPVVVQALADSGHEAVHVGDVLRLDAPDEAIFDLAVHERRVIVAADTDFGEIVARRGTTLPSLVLFHRQVGRRPIEQAQTLLAQLDDVEAELSQGAIVVIEDERIRIRSLPILPTDEDR
jgi:predicted nuclease of predicted toxin-antitoxin system